MRTNLFGALSVLLLASGASCRKPQVGCTDPAYDNYKAENNEDDGCCCNVVNGAGQDATVTLVSTRPFATIPEAIADTPVIHMEATLRRVDQIAEGPCGCLIGTVNGLSSWQEYQPGDGIYAPRKLCNTSITWYWRLDPYTVDSSDWAALAAVNGIDPDAPSMGVTYTLRFTATDGSYFDSTFVDTLRSEVNYYTSSSTARLFGWDVTRRRISGPPLTCQSYPVDMDHVAVISLEVEF